MQQFKAAAVAAIAAFVLSACGGGGGGSEPPPVPVPTPIPETLTITAPATVEAATAVAFGNSAGALAGLRYQWNFGDGGTSTDAAPSHSFASGGEFEVVLKVTNEAGTSRETRSTLSVTNIANVRGLECSGAASTGWCWQNPRPTGNPVNTVFFLNASTGWRGGDKGEIFKTTDSGATWVRQPSGVTEAIRGIRFLDAMTGWATGASGAALRTTDGGSTWVASRLGDKTSYDGNNLATITPVDARTVYVGALADGGGLDLFRELYASRDGGATWQPVSRVPQLITGTGKFWSLQGDTVSLSRDGGLSYTGALTLKLPSGYDSFDATALWALDDLRAVAYTSVSRFDAALQDRRYIASFYTTLDGGVTWSRSDAQGAGVSIGIGRVTSVSADGKVLVAVGSQVRRSTDGGQTWTTLSPPTTDFTWYSTFGGEDIAALSNAGLWLSKNGGQSWSRIGNPLGSSPSGSAQIRRVEGTALTVANYLSKDEGQRWTEIYPVIGNLYTGNSSRVAFVDARNGFMTDALLRSFTTRDGGATWQSRSTPFTEVRSVQFVNRQTGWLVGGDGGLYKSGDLGQTWEPVATVAGAKLQAVYFQNETLGWLRRESGGAPFAATRDGGKTWSDLTLPDTIASLRQGEQAWVAVGAAGAIRASRDMGGSWNAVNSGTAAFLTAVTFSDARTVWAVGTDSTLLKSEDAGSTWAAVKLAVAGTRLRDVKFANAQAGWIVGDGGLVIATRDGGKTWVSQASGTSLGLTSVQVVDANTAWITGFSGLVLATGNGGK